MRMILSGVHLAHQFTIHDGKNNLDVVQIESGDIGEAVRKVRSQFDHPQDEILLIVAGHMVQPPSYTETEPTPLDPSLLAELGLPTDAVFGPAVVSPAPVFTPIGPVQVTPEAWLKPTDPVPCPCGGTSYDGSGECSMYRCVTVRGCKESDILGDPEARSNP